MSYIFSKKKQNKKVYIVFFINLLSVTCKWANKIIFNKMTDRILIGLLFLLLMRWKWPQEREVRFTLFRKRASCKIPPKELYYYPIV